MKPILASVFIYLLISSTYAINLRANANTGMQVTQNDIFYLTEQLLQLQDTDFSRDLASTILLQLKTSHEIDEVLKMLNEIRDRFDQEIRLNDQEFETNSRQLNELITDMTEQQVDAQKQVTAATTGLRAVTNDQDATNSIIKTDEKQLKDLKKDREMIENSFGTVISDLKSRTGEQSKVIAVIDTIISELTKRIESQVVKEEAKDKKKDEKKDGKADGKKDDKKGNSTTTTDKKADTKAATNTTAQTNATAASNATAAAANVTKGAFAELDSKIEALSSDPYYESLAELSRLNPILALAELTTNLDLKKAERIIKKLKDIRAMLAKNLAADKDLLSEKEVALGEALGKLGLLETNLNDELKGMQAKAKRLTLESSRLTTTRETNQKAYDQCTENIKISQGRLTLITSVHDEFKRKKTSELEAVKKAIQVLSAKKNEIRVNTRTSR